MKISHANSLNESIGKYGKNEIAKYLKDFEVTDSKGRYLHWNEFQYKKHPDNFDLGLAWAVIKTKRDLFKKELCPPIGDYSFHFCIPDSLQKAMCDLERNLEEIAKECGCDVRNEHYQKQYLVKALMMEEAISSAQLEGAVTTRKVAKEMLENQRKPKNHSETMIFNNYYLMEKAFEAKEDKLSIDLILNFHKIATEGAIENNAIPGEFRKTNDICIRSFDNEIIYTPPDVAKIYDLMIQLCDFINTDHESENDNLIVYPVIKAILVHFFIGFIHPFGDGNGRTARALFYWYMIKSDYFLFRYISISKLLKQVHTQYVKSYLYTEDDEYDLTYFIYYQMDIINRSIKGLKEYIERKQLELSDFMSIIKNSKKTSDLNLRQKDILKNAVKNPGRLFTPKVIESTYDVSSNTARNDLKILEEKKFLCLIEGRRKRYIAPSNLRELF